MKQIERITCFDRELGKGRDIVFVMEHGKIAGKHIEEINLDDFGGEPYAG
jgi:hypothetical protein